MSELELEGNARSALRDDVPSDVQIGSKRVLARRLQTLPPLVPLMDARAGHMVSPQGRPLPFRPRRMRPRHQLASQMIKLRGGSEGVSASRQQGRRRRYSAMRPHLLTPREGLLFSPARSCTRRVSGSGSSRTRMVAWRRLPGTQRGPQWLATPRKSEQPRVRMTSCRSRQSSCRKLGWLTVLTRSWPQVLSYSSASSVGPGLRVTRRGGWSLSVAARSPTEGTCDSSG